MEELRGPNIQIVLHVKEGIGFGFLTSPFLISGSLNGYLLETDPVVPAHAPSFDSELVWEADKRRFRNLRIQNVPVKVEVYTTATQGRKDKVGYLMLSLLAAQPCPTGRMSNVKNTWHKLLGVKAEGKCCHPQLLLSLTVQDWINTPTPRNELSMFHSNEAATSLTTSVCVPVRPLSLTLEEYISESKKTVSSPDLVPRLLSEEGLIQIGPSENKHLFILSFVIGAVENVDTIIPANVEGGDCSVTYSVFTHTIETDSFETTVEGVRKTSVRFNQRTSLRLCTDLSSLSRYFADCPYVVTRLRCGESDIGICSTDLRKLIPTEDVRTFLGSFCNADKAITIGERCFMMPCQECVTGDSSRKPFLDIEISLGYVGRYKDKTVKPTYQLTTRSASHLGCKSDNKEPTEQLSLEKTKSSSCTDVDRDVARVSYTNNSRHNNVNPINSQNEIADMIRKMYESFTITQERMLNARIPPVTSDVIIQCSDSPANEIPENTSPHVDTDINLGETVSDSVATKDNFDNKETQGIPEAGKTVLIEEKPAVTLSAEDKEYLMKKCVDELEDWKERQQEIFKFQLKQKEEYHLQMLSEEWNKRQSELEGRLGKGIEQCRNLATDLSNATDDFRLRTYNVAQREKKLLQAKQTLEQHFMSRFQELREASRKMDDDMKHQLKLKDMRIEELQLEIDRLHKENNAIKNSSKERHNGGLTKDQTTSLIEELRNLEEKLDEAAQSKAFFKEQWGRAVRELHAVKLLNRRQMLAQVQRRHLDTDFNNIIENGESTKADFKSELSAMLGDDPVVGEISDGIDSQRESVKMPKKNDHLNNLMQQRDRLMLKENPDEEKLTKFNNEIRNILLNNRT